MSYIKVGSSSKHDELVDFERRDGRCCSARCHADQFRAASAAILAPLLFLAHPNSTAHSMTRASPTSSPSSSSAMGTASGSVRCYNGDAARLPCRCRRVQPEGHLCR